MADMQDEKEELLLTTRSSIRMLSFLYFPIMAGLAVVAKPFISILLTDAWLPCVLYLQVYCFEYATWSVQGPLECALKGVGAGTLLLIVEIIRKGGSLIIIFIAMFFGIEAMALAVMATAILNDLLYRIAGRIALKYSIKDQIIDIIPCLLLTLVMACLVYPIQFVIVNNWLLLLCQVLLGIVVYFGVAFLTKNKELEAAIVMLKSFFDKMKHANKEEKLKPQLESNVDKEDNKQE